MSTKKTSSNTSTKRWRATRGVSWTVDGGQTWVNREAGEDVSDAPPAALREWASLDEPAVEEVSGG